MEHIHEAQTTQNSLAEQVDVSSITTMQSLAWSQAQNVEIIAGLLCIK